MMENYQVKRIKQNKETNHLILKVHYAKRKPSISYLYGLFRDEIMVGCISYGTPPSSPLRIGIAGKDNAKKVLELNRLVLKNNLKNEASFLIGKSLQLLKKTLVSATWSVLQTPSRTTLGQCIKRQILFTADYLQSVQTGKSKEKSICMDTQ